MKRKCHNCGFIPEPSFTSAVCPDCMDQILYWCEECSGYSPASTCVNCRERITLENSLEQAVRLQDIATAIRYAADLAGRFPKKPAYGKRLAALQSAERALRECERWTRVPLERFRDVRQAQLAVAQARAAFLAAGLPLHTLEPWEQKFRESAAELEGLERLRWQSWLALIPATIAAYLAAVLYAGAHIAAVAASWYWGTDAAPLVSWYNPIRIGVCITAFVVLIGIVSRRSWSIPAPVMALLQLFVIANFLVILSFIPIRLFWLSLLLFALLGGLLAWVTEAGANPVADPPNRVRRALTAWFVGLLKAKPGDTCVAALLTVTPFILLPWFSLPSPPDDLAQAPASPSAAGDGTSAPGNSPGTDGVSDSPASDPSGTVTPTDRGPASREPAATGSETTSGDAAPAAPAAAPPTLRVVKQLPSTAVAINTAVGVTLEGRGATAEARLEYHVYPKGAGGWTLLPGNEWSGTANEVGMLEVAFQCTDRDTGLASAPVFAAFQVMTPPTVFIKSTTPSQPFLGERVEFELASNYDSDVRFEFRQSEDAPWLPAPGGRFSIEVTDSSHRLWLKSLLPSGLASPELLHFVTATTKVDLTVLVRETTPLVPYYPGEFRIQLGSLRGDGMVFESRRFGEQTWTPCPDGILDLVFDEPQKLNLEFRALDPVRNETSPVLPYTLVVEQPRLVVTALTREGAEVIARMTDQVTGELHTVREGNVVAGLRITSIATRFKKIYVRSEDGKRKFELPIPPAALLDLRN